MSRCLVGTANGACKEVFLLPLAGSETGPETGGGNSEAANDGMNAISDARDVLARSGVDTAAQAGRTKLLREKMAHEAALDQQERAQRVAWGDVAAGTYVSDMLCVPPRDALAGFGFQKKRQKKQKQKKQEDPLTPTVLASVSPAAAVGARAEAESVVFSAVVHEPFRKVRAASVSPESGEVVPVEREHVDEAVAEAAVYTVLECHAAGSGSLASSSSIRRGGFQWAEGAARCVGRSSGSTVDDINAVVGHNNASSPLPQHIPGRIVALAPLRIEFAGCEELVLLSCAASGDLRFHRLMTSSSSSSSSSPSSPSSSSDGDGDNDPVLRGEVASTTTVIGHTLVGSLGGGVGVMRVGHVASSNASPVVDVDVLVGGQNHDLEVWNFALSVARAEKTRKNGSTLSFLAFSVARAPLRTFRAKNLPDDKLEMSPKIWITDLRVLSVARRREEDKTAVVRHRHAKSAPVARDFDYTVAAVTKYGQFRLWNTRERRRCTVNREGISKHPLQSLAVADFGRWFGSSSEPSLASMREIPQFVAAADAVGSLFQIDPSSGSVVAKYKNSSAGALRRNGLQFTVGFMKKSAAQQQQQQQRSESESFSSSSSSSSSSDIEAVPLLVSAGLDRILRCHHALTRKLLHRVFVKQQINCVLPLPLNIPQTQSRERESSLRLQNKNKKKKNGSDSSGSSDDGDWDMDDDDDLLAGVRSAAADTVLAGPEKGQKRKQKGRKNKNKNKNKNEKNDDDDDDDDDDFSAGAAEEDLEAASALAVVEAQMNRVREKGGRTASAARAETARRVRGRQAKRSREIRDFQDLNRRAAAASSSSSSSSSGKTGGASASKRSRKG
jgi:hypothetical protein